MISSFLTNFWLTWNKVIYQMSSTFYLSLWARNRNDLKNTAVPLQSNLMTLAIPNIANGMSWPVMPWPCVSKENK